MRRGWEIKTLADLFDIGSSKRVYESQWRDSGVPFYRAREIVKLSREGFVDNELFIDEDLYKEYAVKYGIPKCGDIMVTGVGTLGVCYVVKENDKFYFKDGNILWFKSKEGTNPFFVNYAFKSDYLRRQIENCNGATVGTFTIVRAKETTIPVPPLSEQQRIVSELDLLSNIIEKKKAQLKEYDQLAQSIFYDMFGDPVTNEKGWEVKKLGEVCYIGLGFTHTPTYVEKGIPFLSVKDISSGIIDFSEIKFVSEEEYLNAPKGAKPNKGDILFCRVGTMGKPVIINTDMQFCTFVSLGYLRILFNQLNNVYVKYWMLSDSFNNQVTANVKGLAIKNLNTGWLKMFDIPLPPLSLQQSFAEKIEAIEKQKELIKQSITETETLFNSRMDYYFN